MNTLPKAKNQLADEAYALYRQGMLLKDIAEKLNVPASTVRRWKSSYKWDNERSDKIASVRKKEKPKKACENDSELTERQELFCLYYIENFNATKAYQRAYECDYNTAMINGSRMLRNAKVKERIEQLTKECLEEIEVDSKLLTKRLVEKHMKIAFSDITDYVEFGEVERVVVGMYGPIQVEDEVTGEKKQLTEKVNVVKFKDSSQVDGTLISEVSNGKNGAKIKLHDSVKAMKWLDDHIGLASEEQRSKIEILKLQKQKLESEAGFDEGDSGVTIINDV